MFTINVRVILLSIYLLPIISGCNDVVGPWATVNGVSNGASRSVSVIGSSSSSLSNYVVTTLAGSGIEGYLDGASNIAAFNRPNDVAVDSAGNVYVADKNNNRIRKITSSGVVSTLAGSGSSGHADGIGTFAGFSSPEGLTVDSVGNIYVSDGNYIRKITSNGVVSTLAGSYSGYADGVGTEARFYLPTGLAVDDLGNVYVADKLNHRIRKITSNGVVTTLAGSGIQGYLDGLSNSATFNSPNDVAVDNAGNIYVADQFNNRIRKINSNGVVTTLSGSGSLGHVDGIGVAASFFLPDGLAVDSVGNVYVSDGSLIRKINSNGVVTTLAGSSPGYADGRGEQARFYSPVGIAIDRIGSIYVADSLNNRIRKLSYAP